MDTFERVDELVGKGQRFCLATIIDTQDPAAPLATKAIVFQDGSVEAEIEKSELRNSLIAAARESLKGRTNRTIEIAPGVRVFLNIFSGHARLLICGAGHIALSLARFAREIGFQITVLDDRPEYAHPSRFPDCQVIAEEFTSGLSKLSVDSSTYVVVITRGHEHDRECLLNILTHKTAYVGLIGSRRRIRFVLQLLEREGIPDSRLRDIFAPVGLPIGAESPQEIALAIAAELVCVRKKGSEPSRAWRRFEAGEGKWGMRYTRAIERNDDE